LDENGVSKLVKSTPQVFCYSIKDNLEPKLAWLQERLELDEKGVRKLVKSMPPVLGMSIEDNLEPKLAWLQERLELDEKGVSKLVKTMPPVLGLSIEDNLEPKLSWLQERLSLDEKSISLVVQRAPSLFGFGIANNLEPTFKFYEDCVGSVAARTMIANNPVLFTVSLEKRLKPRLAEAEAAGIPIDTGTLKRIAKYTAENWSSSMAFQETKLLKQQLRDR
jgi:hypothetical protein